MNKVMLWFCLMACSQSANAQKVPPRPTDSAKQTILKFKETSFDFGMVMEGTEITHEFVFTNLSRKPVQIVGVLCGSGALLATWPREPVAPHKKGRIKLSLTTLNRVGPANQLATVETADSNARIQLCMKGIVFPGRAIKTPAPDLKKADK